MALTNKLSAIGDAIREKTGKTDLMTLDEMPVEIASITTGGGEMPEEAFNFTGDCSYAFTNNNWNWFIDMYGNKITTKDITNAESMFGISDKLEKIPFDINVAKTVESTGGLSSMFRRMEKLKQLPLIKGEINPPTGSYSNNPPLNYMFYGCHTLREIPDDYFDNFGGEAFWAAAKNYTANRACMFTDCYSLRRLPNLKNIVNKSTGYSGLYYGLIQVCYALDEVVDLPVITGVNSTSNNFINTCINVCHLSRFTFETNEDNTPKIVNWKSQTLDLSQNVGYTPYRNYILQYNSGITADKLVKDDATYQALKNDPDWFATNINYSRYNHDSAVATINSLPDTSAYLATTSGTNTIKFKRKSGALTDGGAVDNLTAEEIAVAAAKGWTVTFAN